MPTEVVYATSHLTGTFSNPGNAVGNTPSTWAGVLNENSSYTSRWAIGDPAEALADGATQTVRVSARKGSNSGVPTIALNLYENGTLVQSIMAATNVTSEAGQVLAGTFNTSAVTNPANVEIEVVQVSAGGSPSARNSAQIAYVEWSAEIVASEPEPDRSVHVSFPTPDAVITGEQTFRVLARKVGAGPDPTIEVSLYRAGTLVRSLASQPLTSADGEVVTGTATEAECTPAADVELVVDIFGEIDGSGEVGAIRWDALQVIVPDAFEDLYLDGTELVAWSAGFANGATDAHTYQVKAGTHLELAAGAGTSEQRTYVTDAPVDLTDVTTVRVRWSQTGLGDNTVQFNYLIASTSKTGDHSVADAVFVDGGGWGERTNEIDVTGLSGLHYIRVHARCTNGFAENYLNVYEVDYDPPAVGSEVIPVDASVSVVATSAGLTPSFAALAPVGAVATLAAEAPVLQPAVQVIHPVEAVTTLVAGVPSLSPSAAVVVPVDAVVSLAAEAVSASPTSLVPSSAVLTFAALVPSLVPSSVQVQPAAPAVVVGASAVGIAAGAVTLSLVDPIVQFVAQVSSLVAGEAVLSPAPAQTLVQADAAGLVPAGVSLIPVGPALTVSSGAPVLSAAGASISVSDPTVAFSGAAVSLIPGVAVVVAVSPAVSFSAGAAGLIPSAVTVVPDVAVATFSAAVASLVPEGASVAPGDPIVTVSAEAGSLAPEGVMVSPDEAVVVVSAEGASLAAGGSTLILVDPQVVVVISAASLSPGGATLTSVDPAVSIAAGPGGLVPGDATAAAVDAAVLFVADQPSVTADPVLSPEDAVVGATAGTASLTPTAVALITWDPAVTVTAGGAQLVAGAQSVTVSDPVAALLAGAVSLAAGPGLIVAIEPVVVFITGAIGLAPASGVATLVDPAVAFIAETIEVTPPRGPGRFAHITYEVAGIVVAHEAGELDLSYEVAVTETVYEVEGLDTGVEVVESYIVTINTSEAI